MSRGNYDIYFDFVSTVRENRSLENFVQATNEASSIG